MRIVDAQVHVWSHGEASPHHTTWRPNPFTTDDLLREMDAAGVDCAILAPPTWDPTGNASSLASAARHPHRFAVVGNIDWVGPENRNALRTWREQRGMVGLRLSFNTPDKQARLRTGALDWIWEECAAADLPVMVLIPGGVPLIGDLASRFPGLRLCVDHLGIPRGFKDAAAFAHLPDLLNLAKLPGVSVKVGGLPAYSTTDSYPYPSLHEPFRRVYEAFGPERIFWATDLTRMNKEYCEIVTMFTDGIPWLNARDKQLIMGDAVCRWLDWQPAAASLMTELSPL